MFQLQLSNLQGNQKVNIFAEILASVIHLHTHCDEDLQGAISDELDRQPIRPPGGGTAPSYPFMFTSQTGLQYLKTEKSTTFLSKLPHGIASTINY
jgi:hypothetical protein